MRMLVVGAGSTGGYFGGRLAQAGREVEGSNPSLSANGAVPDDRRISAAGQVRTDVRGGIFMKGNFADWVNDSGMK